MVAGTATEIGKTWVTCRLAEELRRRGVAVSARKPVQSFEPGDDDEGTTDAHLLAAATGERPQQVTPPHRWYPRALAPPMAAAALGLPAIRVDDLVRETTWPTETAVGLIETAGSVRSPLADDGDTAVLAARTRPDLVILVADAALGTIGAVRANQEALAAHRVVVLLNRFDSSDDVHRANLDWLEERCGYGVATGVPTLIGHLR